MRVQPFFLLAALALIPAAGTRADERAAARRYEIARHDEPSLIAFLRRFPKGGDLHDHISGAFYPEDGLREAIAHHLYFDPRTSRFEHDPAPGRVPAERLRGDDALRQQFYDAATMRAGWGDRTGAYGHDHFFSVFGINSSPWRETPVEVPLSLLAKRAELQNVQYLELMHDPGVPALGEMFRSVGQGTPDEMLARLRPVLPEYVRQAREAFDDWDRKAPPLAGLTGPITAASSPVTFRFLASPLRAAPDETSFAIWAGAFALMKADPRMVGVNFVAPEDGPVSRDRFLPQMRLLDYLWQRFGHPNVTLHAGELNPLVSPLEDMTGHIRGSIEIGHARRIGHGNAIAWENDVDGLLRKMREEGIAVEVCPTSEAVILGQEGDRHPFMLYRRAGVPLTLNTDDEGVLRTNLTLEFVRAARSWNLSYADLKELARNSLEYSFLPGASLFEQRDYRRLRPEFRGLRERGWAPNADDAKLLAASDRATVQARLERAFVEFER